MSEVDFVLMVVADRDYLGDDERWLRALRTVAEAAIARPVAIQVRAKGVAPETFASLASRARDVVPAGVALLLNGEAALAARLGYDGVHWPEASIPQVRDPSGVRWRTAAVHAGEAIRVAERAGADALVFGSVFAPGSKIGTARGTAALRALTQATALPVFAIGGVTPSRIASCLEAGARGVAVVSGVLGDPAPDEASARYLSCLPPVVCSANKQRTSRHAPSATTP